MYFTYFGRVGDVGGNGMSKLHLVRVLQPFCGVKGLKARSVVPGLKMASDALYLGVFESTRTS